MDNLDLQQLELLVYLFAGLIILVLIALVIYVVISVRRRNAEASAALITADDLVVRPSLLVVGQILALVRDEAGGPIKVEIEGTKYASLPQIKDPQVKRQVVDAALELIQFTGVLGEGDLRPTPIGKTDTWREDMREGSHSTLEKSRVSSGDEKVSSPPPTVPAEVEERFLDLLSEMGQERSLSRPSLTGSLQRSLKPKPLESESPRSFVDDIEEIVQRRVQMVPALAGRGLHVRPGPSGKVLFTFEGQDYDGVDDVPNYTARQVIKDAIQEWDELT